MTLDLHDGGVYYHTATYPVILGPVPVPERAAWPPTLAATRLSNPAPATV